MVAIDLSQVAIDALSKITIEKNLPIRPMIHNPCEGIPFDNSYFDAVYSHMLWSIRKVTETGKLGIDSITEQLTVRNPTGGASTSETDE